MTRVPELPEDIYRKIINYSLSSNSRSIFALKNLNPDFKDLVEDQVARASKKNTLIFDIEKLFLDENPLRQQFYEPNNKEHIKNLHQNIRKLCDILEGLLRIGGNLGVENMTAKSVGWICGFDEMTMKRVPFMLQKRVVNILKQFNGSKVEYSPVFMKPSRFIRTFSHRFETITELDLGGVKALAAIRLRNNVFPKLINLEKLVWHHATIEFLKKLTNRQNMRKLEITAHPVGRPTSENFAHLCDFGNLEKLYFGFTCPKNPSRFMMETLLTLYQAIWRKKMGTEDKKLLDYLSNLKEIGFWNAPERIFIDMCNKNLEFETMNFGILSQELSKMCSFDSIMQALFKFEESNFTFSDIKLNHLNMNLHSMPAVQLEYYLPNLMNMINKMTKIEKVTLFVKCIFGGEMDSSWSLETKKEKLQKKSPIFESNFRSFEFHCDGFCMLTDLERQLPPSIQKVAISLNLPEDAPNQKAVQSIGSFLEKLANLNNFPDLEEVHLQVYGIRCMEYIVDKCEENLSGLKMLSIVAMPANQGLGIAENLLKKMRKIGKDVKVSREFAEYLKMRKSKEKEVKIGRLFEKYWPKPNFEKTFVDGEDVYEIPVEKSIINLEEDEDSEFDDEEEDSFVVNEAEDSMISDGEGEPDVNMSMDELDLLEKKLEKESHRRHEKYLKKRRAKIESESEEEPDEDEHDVVDFENLEDDDSEGEESRRNKKLNGFFDDEAEESDGEESEVDDEEGEIEEEGEDLADSDDEVLFIRGPKKRKMEDCRGILTKRNRIVVSDDED